MSESSPLPCNHRTKLRARNVCVVIRDGHLTSAKSGGIRHDLVEFCASPTCEHVFRAERKQREFPVRHLPGPLEQVLGFARVVEAAVVARMAS